MRTRALRRVLGALALPGAIATASAPGCEPQDIYLFDEAAEAAEPDAGGAEPEPSPPSKPEPDMADDEDAGAPMQPACVTPACENCEADGDCDVESTTYFCHPVTASCRLACDPEAPLNSRPCPGDERCDARGLCVDCVVDADCGPGPLPVCDRTRNVCVECTTGSNCSSELPVCDVEASRCVECVVDRDCLATGEVCLPGAQRCVQCRDDADCSSFDEANRCVPDLLICAECAVDADCASDPSRPFCKLSEHECDDERD
jgi:hypothetical protein